MKKLYIRFFEHAENTVPVNSECVCRRVFSDYQTTSNVKSYAGDVTSWMMSHPNGKVDFVWLT
jgi:hypothetical protein